MADFGEVGDEGFVVLLENLRADGHPQHGVLAGGAGAVAAHAVHAGLGLEVLLIAIVDQRIEAVDAFGPHIAAAAAIAAIGAAEFDEFLAAEGDGAGAAIATPDIDLGLVEKLHDPVLVLLRSRDVWSLSWPGWRVR